MELTGKELLFTSKTFHKTKCHSRDTLSVRGYLKIS